MKLTPFHGHFIVRPEGVQDALAAYIKAALFDAPSHQRKHNNRQQKVDQRVLKLRQHPSPSGHFWHCAHFIAAEC